MGGVARLVMQRPLDDGGNLIVLDGARPPRARLVQQAVQAILDKPPTPLADRVLVETQLRSDLLVGKAICTPQNYSAAIRE